MPQKCVHETVCHVFSRYTSQIIIVPNQDLRLLRATYHVCFQCFSSQRQLKNKITSFTSSQRMYYHMDNDMVELHKPCFLSSTCLVLDSKMKMLLKLFLEHWTNALLNWFNCKCSNIYINHLRKYYLEIGINLERSFRKIAHCCANSWEKSSRKPFHLTFRWANRIWRTS